MTRKVNQIEYLPGVIHHKVLDTIKEDKISKIDLYEPELTTPVINETFSTLAQLIGEEASLNELILKSFQPTMKEAMSETVME